MAGRPDGKALRIVDENVAHAVHTSDKIDLDAVDAVYRLQHADVGFPYEAVGGIQIRLGRRRRCDAADRGNQLFEFFSERFDRGFRHGRSGELLLRGTDTRIRRKAKEKAWFSLGKIAVPPLLGLSRSGDLVELRDKQLPWPQNRVTTMRKP